jgi:hypothetical protein
MKCTHLKENGQKCGAWAMRGAEFCFLHNPAIPDEEKRKAQALGGAVRAVAVKEPMTPMLIEKPSDTVALLADTVHRVRAGTLDIRIANCIGVLCGHLIKAFETAQQGERLEYIEKVILEKRINGLTGSKGRG